MEDLTEVMQLCRLCLVKDQVNIPIFKKHDDTSQILLKISACLPVKVKQEDNLPKKICDSCLNKLEMLHHFRNISADSEKKLLEWLNKIRSRKTVPAVYALQSTDANTDDIEIKEAATQFEKVHSNNVDVLQLVYISEVPTSLNKSSQHSIESQEDSIMNDETVIILTDNENVEQVRKRKKRAFASEGEDGNADGVKSKLFKPEQEKQVAANQIPQPIDFIDVSSLNNEQSAGPSKIIKSNNEAQYLILQPISPVIAPRIVFCNNMQLPAVIHPINQTYLPAVIDSSNPIPSNMQLPTRIPIYSEHNYAKLHINTPLTPTAVPSNQMSKPHSCKSCSKEFATYKDLNDHRRIVHVEYKWPCSICGRKFKRPSQVKQHQLIHSTEKTFEKEFYLKFHLKQHKQEFQYTCEICSKCFVFKSQYERHKKIHSDQRFKCEHCNTVYKQEDYYLKHLEIHKPDYKPKPFTCTVCNAKLKTKLTLRLHMRTHNVGCRYVCDVCGKHGASSESFKAHLRTHSGEKPYMCDFCGRRFNRKYQFKVHRYTHTKEKPYVCSICQQRFTQRTSLAVHLRRHSDERPYKCDICAKGFVTRSLLKAHLRTHSGEKPYMCDFCGRRFNRKYQFKVHRYIHTKEKPYVCSICQQRFTQRTSLTVHLRRHSGEKPYKCDICARGFVTGTLLKMHMKKAHDTTS